MQLGGCECTGIDVRAVFVEVIVTLTEFGELIGNDVGECRADNCIWRR